MHGLVLGGIGLGYCFLYITTKGIGDDHFRVIYLHCRAPYRLTAKVDCLGIHVRFSKYL